MIALRDQRWEQHQREWRDPLQVVSQWEDASRVPDDLLQYRTVGPWWDLLASLEITLLITREYEHLIMALSTDQGRPSLSFFRLPHPSGLAFDRDRGLVYVASTRNPNQIFDLAPARGPADHHPVLLPVRSRFLPGRTYLHDLALVGDALHANAVGQNAILRIDPDGTASRVWWPAAIERDGTPVFCRNHLQLNSIAAGPTIDRSFFSASAASMSARRPGHRNFPVDRRGVIFSGRTREPMAFGLTRPHSARLQGDQLWVDNSGYGEVGLVREERFTPVARLPGWTRGLHFHGDLAFAGTSRVIPRFRQYAPGLDVDSSLCGVHAVDTRTGAVQASLLWPNGNQIFAIEAIPRRLAAGFPFTAGRRSTARERKIFYDYSPTDH